jgi:hypothetical protein
MLGAALARGDDQRHVARRANKHQTNKRWQDDIVRSDQGGVI